MLWIQSRLCQCGLSIDAVLPAAFQNEESFKKSLEMPRGLGSAGNDTVP